MITYMIEKEEEEENKAQSYSQIIHITFCVFKCHFLVTFKSRKAMNYNLEVFKISNQ